MCAGDQESHQSQVFLVKTVRSLLNWQFHYSNHFPFRAENKHIHGRFRIGRSMNDHAIEPAPGSPIRFNFSANHFPSIDTQTADMSQFTSSDTSKDLPAAPDDSERLIHRFHQHNLSDSTTGSYESSPTTTISTVDDSSATEQSPDSSPESPPPSTFTTALLRPRTAHESGAPYFELQKQPLPKKGRNLKNLAVNTARPGQRAASTTSLPLGPTNDEDLSGIASPGFVKPPSPPKTKKRPSKLGLTLLTPGLSKAAPLEIKLAIPQTPALIRPTLRHFQSSPSLPAFAGIGRPAGIRPHGSHVPVALDAIMSPTEARGTVHIDEEEQNFDVPLSREEKPEAYPDGPICVYEPYIDLYLEPTAEQCRQYDVVMNVASEVLNPLVQQQEAALEEPEIRIDGGGGIQYAPKRPNLTALKIEEVEANQTDSPTTPKATPLISNFPSKFDSATTSKDPEYIHIKWEHNSDIVPDLLRLVKLIDDRVSQGKRVLIHCQCGVSRSASLVVAYGLYKEPSMSVQEAYDAVKMKSKWIGPNMNLIMQLQEFRTSLSRGGLLSGDRGLSPITPSSAFTEWRGPLSINPPGRTPLSGSMFPRDLPMTAGLTTAGATGKAVEVLPILSPGPSSAPSGLAWPVDMVPPLPTFRHRASSAANAAVVEPATTAYVDPSGHIVPVLKVEVDGISDLQAKSTTPSYKEKESTVTMEPVSSPTAAHFAMAPLHPAKEFDPQDQFGLMSPSSTEFSSSPFDRSALLASLGMGSVHHQDEAPTRRSKSLRSSSQRSTNDTSSHGLQPKHGLGARKISSPNLREQRQLQNLQAKIKATLPLRNLPASSFDEALMSPRAEEFTKNPFALSMAVPTIETTGETPRTNVADPRSPAQTGVSPITRNIMDFL
ncbi:Hypothetical protein R9X50_00125100 [Acrodontium crateriforme]|uniref:protein-tyrosine-phosphatase n=1 Tax=Acrodontium crateriforme TaxID=150365 RepID=A0AAQ3R2Q3_9PEZI|nr:Hypothetical protein R9X50_00125100 [Acrodontium crateriforme]